PQALFSLPPLRGLVLVGGGAPGVFWEGYAASLGPAYTHPRGSLARTPPAGRRLLAVGRGAGLVGGTDPERVSAAPQRGAVLGGGQHAQGQADQEKSFGQGGVRSPLRLEEMLGVDGQDIVHIIGGKADR